MIEHFKTEYDQTVSRAFTNASPHIKSEEYSYILQNIESL